MTHPYRDLPDRNFWRRSVSAVEPCFVDPVGDVRFQIKDTDIVATAGSCFAQHIARVLSQSGYRYLVTETADDDKDEATIKAHNYGTFTARYGNVYTARQLLQLLQEAYGERTPVETLWTRKDGRLVDALRPAITPDGYDNAEDLLQARQVMLAAVRKMVTEMDIFMFTLGLTESWSSRTDGTVYPIAPGAGAGDYDPEKYVFHNFTLAEVSADMAAALQLLKSKNPRLRAVITVSPVPLVATYEQRHVLTSTVYSKSVLRVAAQEMIETFEWVDYFPSYEVITASGNTQAYYEADRREVGSIGVTRAMSLFQHHYMEMTQTSASPLQLSVPNRSSKDLVCDEEMLDVVKS
jgi:hypothetical protein